MARSPAKRVVGTLLFLLAFVAVLAFYFLLFADAQQVGGLPGVDQTAGVAIGVAVLLGLIAVILVALLAGRRRREESSDDAPYFLPPESRSPATPVFEEEEVVVEDDLVVYDVWRLPLARRSWGQDERGLHTFYFPLNVESGVYVNDYIPLARDPHGPRLKLRTLLAGPPDVGAASFVIPQAQAQRELAPEPPRQSRTPPAERRPGRPRQDVPGEDFMRELERRFDERKQGSQVAVAETAHVYYDFQGDNHEVLDVKGIGAAYATKLQELGIRTTARLCYEDAAQLATRISVPRKTVESWQAMAELMKINGIGPQYAEALVRSGIDGIDTLKRRTPERVAEEVNQYLGSLDANAAGQKISEHRVAAWQTSAKAMRRVRQQMPPQ